MTKFFVVMGCLFLVAAVIAKAIAFVNPGLVLWLIKPSSFLILANTSFILAILLKK